MHKVISVWGWAIYFFFQIIKFTLLTVRLFCFSFAVWFVYSFLHCLMTPLDFGNHFFFIFFCYSEPMQCFVCNYCLYVWCANVTTPRSQRYSLHFVLDFLQNNMLVCQVQLAYHCCVSVLSIAIQFQIFQSDYKYFIDDFALNSK